MLKEINKVNSVSGASDEDKNKSKRRVIHSGISYKSKSIVFYLHNNNVIKKYLKNH